MGVKTVVAIVSSIILILITVLIFLLLQLVHNTETDTQISINLSNNLSNNISNNSNEQKTKKTEETKNEDKESTTKVITEKQPVLSWMQTIKYRGEKNDLIKQLVVKDNVLYFSGTSNGAFSIGDGTHENTKTESFFIAGYDAKGNINFMKQITSDDDVYVQDILENNNNLYVLGETKGAMDFDNLVLQNNDKFEYQGNTDLFLVSYNKKGDELILSTPSSASKKDTAQEILFDEKNNKFTLFGKTKSLLRFDDQQEYKLYPQDYNSFAVQFDTNYKVSYSMTIPADIVSADVDDDGNLYLAGNFNEDIESATVDISNAGDTDIFIMKSSSTDSWITTLQGISEDTIEKIIVTDAVYVIGHSKSDFYFGNTIVQNSGDQDFFIAKYTLVGNPEWIISSKGLGNEYILDIAANEFNDLFITGYATNMELGRLKHTDSGRGDLFVAKIAEGVPLWITSTKGPGVEVPLKLIVEDGVFVGGTTNHNIDFGNNVYMENQGENDFFVVKYTQSGTPLWVITSLPAEFETIQSSEKVKVEGSGKENDELVDFDIKNNHLYIAGNTRGNLDFGNNYFVENKGGYDFFIASYELQN